MLQQPFTFDYSNFIYSSEKEISKKVLLVTEQTRLADL